MINVTDYQFRDITTNDIWLSQVSCVCGHPNMAWCIQHAWVH